MSNSGYLGYAIGAVLGVATFFAAPLLGIPFLAAHAAFAGLAVFAFSSSFLVRPSTPQSPGSKPQDFSNSGRVYSGRDAVSQNLEMNSATEGIPVPVVFGTCRIGANNIRYDVQTFRADPIVERIQTAPEAVAYALARDTFRTSPAKVDHVIDESAKKQGQSAGKGKSAGGKGGAPKTPPPSQSFTDDDKINQYTTILLADDSTGKNRLPKEYQERTVGHKYYLTFELLVCMGEVSALHAIRVYPGEDAAVDRADSPAISSDDTVMTGEGGTQGGAIRFYRGSAAQVRNAADFYKEDWTNYRGVSFALFDDYWIGNNPSPFSYAFEVERIPVVLDADGLAIEDFELRAGTDTVAVTATAADWDAGAITVTAAGHGVSPGDTFFLTGFDPPAYNGTYVATAVAGDDITADLMIVPATAVTFGTLQETPHATPVAVSSASWATGVLSLHTPSHGLVIDQQFVLAGFTPSAYNGTYTVVTALDSDHVTAALVSDPGTDTVQGTSQAVPLPLSITSAEFADNVGSFAVSGTMVSSVGDSVTIVGMEPAEWNGTFLIAATPSSSEADLTMQLDPGIVEELGTVKLRPDEGYGDANPAAILYELLTNRIWGMGLSPTMIDIPSFVTASQYFFAQGLGMSFALDSQSNVGDVIDTVRQHVQTAVIPIGDKIYCRCLLDPAIAYVPRITLSSDQVTNVQIVRPTWSAAVNELRGTFSARNNNYQSTVVVAHDDAAVATIDRITSQTVNLPAFSNRSVAEQSVQRMLGELSYPRAVLTFEMSRWASNLYCTGFLEFRWAEWNDGTTTTYWHVTEISDADTEGGSIKVTAVEDIYATPLLGISDSFAVPVPAWIGAPRTTDEELDFSNQTESIDFGDYWINIEEMPIPLTDGDRIIAVFAQKTSAFLQGFAFFWRGPASATLTLTSLPVADETVTVQAQVYTWKASVGTTANQVKIETSIEASLANLVAAINGGPGPGTAYGSLTVPNAYVKALSDGLTAVIVEALFAGEGAEDYEVSETMGAGSWNDPNLNLGDFTLMGKVSPWCITGKLVDDLPIGLSVTRAGVFEIQLDNADERARMLSYCSLAPTDADDLDRVTAALTNWLVMGGEYIQIAQAEAGSQFNRVRCTAYIRSQYGSEQKAHAAGTRAAFAYDFVPYEHTLRYENMPTETELEIKAVALDRRGLSNTETTFKQTFSGLARKPLRVESIDSSAAGLVYSVTYRPRWHDRGADRTGEIENDLEAIATEIPTGYETFVMPQNSAQAAAADIVALTGLAGLIDAPVRVTVAFTPEDVDDVDGGMISFSYTAPSTTASLLVYQALNGVLGLPVRTIPT